MLLAFNGYYDTATEMAVWFRRAPADRPTVPDLDPHEDAIAKMNMLIRLVGPPKVNAASESLWGAAQGFIQVHRVDVCKRSCSPW